LFNMSSPALTFRPATAADAAALRRLAALDSADPLSGEVVLAESDGRLVAAISASGRVVADPFVPTATTVQLLRTASWAARPTARRPRLRLGFRPATG
jgi:hypothetical protein